MAIPIVLASASPRRKELLRNVAPHFLVHPSDADETGFEHLPPDIIPQKLAQKKAFAVAEAYEQALVIGADTVVILGYDVLNKPESADKARHMLQLLSGNTHRVVTGVALVLKCESTVKELVFSTSTSVTFGKLTENEIDDYIATGSPLDKAGAYGIQDGWTSKFVQKIEGDFYNVVGFPVFDFYHHLRTFYPQAIFGS